MRTVAIFIFDEVEVLDFAGPFEIFGVAGKQVGEGHFEVFTVAEKPSVSARNNLVITPTYTFENAQFQIFCSFLAVVVFMLTVLLLVAAEKCTTKN